MKRTVSILFTLLLSLPFFAAAQDKDPLKLAATIPLPGSKMETSTILPQTLTATAYF